MTSTRTNAEIAREIIRAWNTESVVTKVDAHDYLEHLITAALDAKDTSVNIEPWRCALCGENNAAPKPAIYREEIERVLAALRSIHENRCCFVSDVLALVEKWGRTP